MTGKKINPLKIKQINPYCDIVIHGIAWKSLGEIPGVGWQIRTKDRPYQHDVLTKARFEEEDTKTIHLVDAVQSYAEYHSYTPLQHFVGNTRSIWMEVVKTALDEGEIPKVTEGKLRTLIESKLEEVTKRVKDYCETENFDYAAERKKSNFGGSIDKAESGDFDVGRIKPCPRTLKDLYNRWSESGEDYYRTLIPRWGGHEKGGRSINATTWGFIQRHIKAYCSEKEPSLQVVCDKINAHIVEANNGLGPDAQIPLATEYGCAKAIEELPYAVVFGSRRGKKQLIQELRHVGKGHEYKRVGELTLSDCWSAHIFTLLSEESQKLFTNGEKSTRVALAFVVDGATGVVTGIAGGTKETSELARRAFRMSFADKTDIARAAGCLHHWNMRHGSEEAKSDSGRAYRNEIYLGTAYALVDRVTFTAAGQARLRGKIERLLRTMGTKFISSFTGRTGSNVKDRPSGEQDPEKRAVLFVEQFMRLIIKYIVDVYHNTPPTRGGLSPARLYEDRIARFQPKPVPSGDELRVAFGLVVQRRLSRAGIRFMNIIYWCPWLDTLIQDSGKRDYFVKVDPLDLEHISILVGSDWTTVPGPPQFQNVTLNQWIAKQNELARAHGEKKRLDFEEFVAPSLLEIDRAAEAAEAAFGLEGVTWTAQMMDDIQKDLRVMLVYDRDAEDDESALTHDSSLLGVVHTRDSAPSPSTQVAPALEAQNAAALPLPPPAVAATKPVAAPPMPMRRNHPRKPK
ncbi:Mu transposase C-terminal domain-containing protein [Devosia sp.]|uniref:Mu transposase C-terminal domain-containing protein n=1 Tax=Devosia sp. TaxID=1871048 RepID=UPI001AC8AB71|nr:Mu transposase C-terminal domain-containing protein [Devosia sp.]MBN9335190.1 Mu transposase C-terminal domain-containing protein [Devosia sp.]